MWDSLDHALAHLGDNFPDVVLIDRSNACNEWAQAVVERFDIPIIVLDGGSPIELNPAGGEPPPHLVKPVDPGELRIAIEVTCCRHEADRKVRENENFYRSLFLSNHSVMLIVEPKSGTIADANPAAVRFYGYPKEVLVGKPVVEINILPQEQILREMEIARQEKRSYFNMRHRLADGRVRDVEIYSGPILLAGRELLYSIVHDVSVRKDIERQLQEQRATLNTVVNTAPIGIGLVSGQIIRWVNRQLLDMLDFSEEEIVGKNTQAFLAGEHGFEGLHGQGSLETRWQRKDGKVIQIQVHAEPTNPGAANSETIFIAEDVSERKKAEDALRKSETRYRELFNTMLNGFALHEIILDSKGQPVNYRFLEVNPAFESLVGIKASDLIGQTVLEAMPDVEGHWIETYGQVALTGVPHPV